MNENVQNPSFPKVNLTVKDGDGNILIVKTPCQPHELSAVLAIYQPEWTICLTAVE